MIHDSRWPMCVAVRCSTLQCIVVCCSVRCSVLQGGSTLYSDFTIHDSRGQCASQRVAARCSVLQCVLQCVAVYDSP